MYTKVRPFPRARGKGLKLAWESAYKTHPSIQSSVNELGDLVCMCVCGEREREGGGDVKCATIKNLHRYKLQR